MVLDAHGVPVDSGYGTTFNHVIWIVKAMSDTTSFLGGAALAGLVAVVVLRGGISFGSANSPLVGVQPGFSLPSAVPNMGMNPNMPTVPLPMPIASPVSSEKQDYDSVKLQFRVEQLQGQVEQQQTQLRSQQVMIDTLSAQSRTGVWNGQQPAPPAPSVVPQLQAGNPNFDHGGGLANGLPWALGGVLLAFGGGIALVGMSSLFSRQNRPGRTIEFVHDDYSPYLPQQRRRVQVLPPRRSIRRIDVEDED
jgi:hypothetical protein